MSLRLDEEPCGGASDLTYDLDEIPARHVARVADHALGDEVRLVRADDLES